MLLAGAGRAGMVHGRKLRGRGARRPSGVADPDAASRERAAAELGCPAHADPVAAATDDGVDAVVIGAPTFAHAEVALAALAAGKHVLCEKPLAATFEEATSCCADAAAQASGAFMMGFMRRFDAGFVRAAERIEAGDTRRLVLVHSTTRGPGLPPEWAWDHRQVRRVGRRGQLPRPGHGSLAVRPGVHRRVRGGPGRQRPTCRPPTPASSTWSSPRST